MAKLSDDVLDAGRKHLRDGDLEGFMSWVASVPIPIDHADVRRYMGRCLESGDTARALRLFDAVWPKCDPVVDGLRALARWAMVLFAVVGMAAVFVAAILHVADWVMK